ncbi:MAG: ATP phosphoribosyltransferase [Candidatus Moranbacteria bacterium RIFCSPLOWO2_02_FULL_48_19]|nr:MAG: ATP phosphoribosyltransferase [Candidatus Moranbacteria bacterium RIFCSPLOWO2_02_FULL_48_19]OGI30756.1 MAG: ATP phosphoribosyltransferase [Candidatus Moranbacteria bacterium RIFCSPLOWO2_12_FULL_48_12]
MLKLALPTGRLQEPVLQLLRDAFINFEYESRKHTLPIQGYASVSEAVLMRSKQIPELVAQGHYDIGICGLDTVHESGRKVEILEDLSSRDSYGKRSGEKVDIVLFGAKKDGYFFWENMPRIKVLSEYPRMTRAFFNKRGGLWKRIKVIPSAGSSEAHVPAHFRWGVCATETGESLAKNDLDVIDIVFSSSIVLVANRKALVRKEKSEEIRGFRHQLSGAVKARESILLKMNVPLKCQAQIIRLLPAMRKPTVSPLAGINDFSAIESVVPKSVLNMLIPKLLKLGAEGIIILPLLSVIEKW